MPDNRKDALDKQGRVIRYLVLLWLRNNDANGCYTDEQCDVEQLPRFNTRQALQAMLEQLPEEVV